MNTEVAYVINTFILLFSASLVMWMSAGFCMLESGLVRSKSSAVICLKNIVLYSIACLCYYVLGYNLMYIDVGSFIGSITWFADINPSELILMDGAAATETASHVAKVVETKYSSLASIFFQMTFVGTTASVISGTLAERVKLWPFFIFIIALTTLIYPIQGAWSWGGGWLSSLGFVDFAGSTVVHSVGGWAALTGAFFLGARKGKYREDGSVDPYYTFPSNVPLVSLGVFILWLGWFGFNGGSLLVTSGVAEISKMSRIFLNTNLAAASGVICTLMFGRFVYGKLNILVILNGALAGLVSVTAGPDFSSPLYAIFVGGVGGILATLAVPVLDYFKIDDVVGAIPVHLVAGIWGTLAVGIFGPASFMSQLIGVLSVAGFVVVTTSIIWLILKKTIGIRISVDSEDLGQDILELGIEAYPEFLTVQGATENSEKN